MIGTMLSSICYGREFKGCIPLYGSVHLANIIMLLCTSTNTLNQFLTCSNVQLSF